MKVSIIKSFLFVLIALIFSACLKKTAEEKWRHIEISPLDDSQIVTVITNGDNRYIMNGKRESESIPTDDYMLLDLSMVDEFGDGLSICWDEDNYKWKLASSYAKLIENKLDTSKYTYYQSVDFNDSTLIIDYKKANCGNFLIRENREPWGNLKVNYITN